MAEPKAEKRPVGRPPLSDEEKARRAELKRKNNPAGTNGGARPGAGRPKGSKNIHSYEAVKKLEALGFDPIEKLIEQYHSLIALTEETTELSDGRIVPVLKPGSQAHASILSTLKGITDTLMRYGYRQVPEKQEVEVNQRTPTMITLTRKKEKD